MRPALYRPYGHPHFYCAGLSNDEVMPPPIRTRDLPLPQATYPDTVADLGITFEERGGRRIRALEAKIAKIRAWMARKAVRRAGRVSRPVEVGEDYMSAGLSSGSLEGLGVLGDLGKRKKKGFMKKMMKHHKKMIRFGFKKKRHKSRPAGGPPEVEEVPQETIIAAQAAPPSPPFLPQDRAPYGAARSEYLQTSYLPIVSHPPAAAMFRPPPPELPPESEPPPFEPGEMPAAREEALVPPDRMAPPERVFEVSPGVEIEADVPPPFLEPELPPDLLPEEAGSSPTEGMIGQQVGSLEWAQIVAAVPALVKGLKKKKKKKKARAGVPAAAVPAAAPGAAFPWVPVGIGAGVLLLFLFFGQAISGVRMVRRAA